MHKSIAVILACLLATAVQAKDSPARQRIAETLEALAPGAEVTHVEPSPIPGLYQVVVDGRVVYVSENGRYLVQGTIFDAKKHLNLTAKASAKVRRKLLAQVDPDKTITFAPPPDEIRHEVMVFTDIDCPYCRKMHSQIQAYNEYGIAVHYLFFPRAGIGSRSFRKAVSVWCAEDSKAALTAAKNGNPPKPLTCENPVKEQYLLGRKLGIRGTPGVIAENGQIVGGYLPPRRLAQKLDALEASN